MVYERVLMPAICGTAAAKLKRARVVKSIAERMLMVFVTSLKFRSLGPRATGRLFVLCKHEALFRRRYLLELSRCR